MTPPAHAADEEDQAQPEPPEGTDPQAPDTTDAADKADTPSQRARAAFLEGTRLAREAQWAQALAAFERASAIKPHPVTTYNIGTCKRAIGAYAQAYLTFQQALREHEASGGTEPSAEGLPAVLVGQTQAFLAEIEQLLVTVDLTVVPSEVSLAVDGRPLLRVGEPVAIYYGGVRPAGRGEVLAESTLVLRLDPGAHVFTFDRPGFERVVVNKTFSPGVRRPLRIELDRLPARVLLEASVPGALVAVNGREVGPTPLELARPAGRYQLSIQKEGYEPYESTLDLRPGQELRLRAPLQPEETSVFTTWWFWTAAGAVVAGGITATYSLTRPDPEPPPYDGGTLDWVVFPEGLRF
ncbi:MAG: PEGA domain-containing protein [Myxococcales bacterium]|nr:PEGA domain-containing protein [Myxococcales bacterium]